MEIPVEDWMNENGESPHTIFSFVIISFLVFGDILRNIMVVFMISGDNSSAFQRIDWIHNAMPVLFSSLQYIRYNEFPDKWIVIAHVE